jgi:hypothetical protein
MRSVGHRSTEVGAKHGVKMRSVCRKLSVSNIPGSLSCTRLTGSGADEGL